MKRLTNKKKIGIVLSLLILVLLALLTLLSGCTTPPSGVKASLYTAESVLAATVADAQAAQVAPWAEPAGETVEQKVDRLELQTSILVGTMDQARANLQAVIDWSVANRKTPLPELGKGGDK